MLSFQRQAQYMIDKWYILKENQKECRFSSKAYHRKVVPRGLKEPGPDFTLEEFQAYDHEFKTQYVRGRQCASSKGNWTPSVEDIEGEYWRMMQKPTEKIEVLYGADLQTGEFSSGFPKNTDQAELDSDAKYRNSGWNLNNFPRLPGSLLSYECSDIIGVLVPWLYVGMCFSSFCCRVEDYHLYSLNYMHWGEPMVWYGVPSIATRGNNEEAFA